MHMAPMCQGSIYYNGTRIWNLCRTTWSNALYTCPVHTFIYIARCYTALQGLMEGEGPGGPDPPPPFWPGLPLNIFNAVQCLNGFPSFYKTPPPPQKVSESAPAVCMLLILVLLFCSNLTASGGLSVAASIGVSLAAVLVTLATIIATIVTVIRIRRHRQVKKKRTTHMVNAHVSSKQPRECRATSAK